MIFEHELFHGTLIKRYKRFLADVKLDTGEIVTAHCANSGSMLTLKDDGNEVWLSPAANPKAKLDYKWEIVKANDAMVGINTSLPNKLVEDAILDGTISEVSDYENLRREMKYGKNSRIDIFLSGHKNGQPDCYVEVKSVTLSREKGLGEFPDSVTSRGTKHLNELKNMVAEGHRSVMLYLAQRNDINAFKVASDIDPAYADALKVAKENGVEAYCYVCDITPKGIKVEHSIPILEDK
ncbi:MAG: DNA/RNA nuclease SfsA [Emcibacteraceae bacterium]|nr:DNA/RNA nuclease SfsA [Emcibacteraceae bacterium]